MSYRKFISGFFCSLLTVIPALADDPIVTFDFEDINGISEMWDSGFSTTSGDYTLNAALGCGAVNWPAGDAREWEGAYGFLYGPGATQNPATLTLFDEAALENRWFVLHSIGLSADDTNGTATVTGLLEGEVQWVISVTEGAAVSNWPDSDAIYPVYTNGHPSVSADISSLPVDEMIWDSTVFAWGIQMDDVVVQAVPAVRTQIKLYQWGLDNHWTPHTAWNAEHTFFGEGGYWWSGYWSTNDVKVIQHRPGLENLPENGGFDDIPGDIFVGGSGWSGLRSNEKVASSNLNAFVVDFETRLFISGQESDHILDVYFDQYPSNTINYFGGDNDTFSADELGFAIWQNAVSNDIRITFDSGDVSMLVTPPVLVIPLADLGFTSLTNGANGDVLAVNYSATKTSIPDTWECSLSISNTATADSWNTGTVAVESASAYNNEQRFCMATADDLSNGDQSSGNGGLGGYEIDQLFVTALLNQEVSVGYQKYVEDHNLVYGVPGTDYYDDYDLDGLLNINEYAYNGDMTNGSVAPAALPTMMVSNNVAYYSAVQLKDPGKTVSYSMQATDDLTIGFAEPAWEVTDVDPEYDTYYMKVTGGLNVSGASFFKTIVTTNMP